MCAAQALLCANTAPQISVENTTLKMAARKKMSYYSVLHMFHVLPGCSQVEVKPRHHSVSVWFCFYPFTWAGWGFALSFLFICCAQCRCCYRKNTNLFSHVQSPMYFGSYCTTVLTPPHLPLVLSGSQEEVYLKLGVKWRSKFWAVSKSIHSSLVGRVPFMPGVEIAVFSISVKCFILIYLILIQPF